MALDQNLLAEVGVYEATIRTQARRVAESVGVDGEMRRTSAHRAKSPIDYMRYAEFGAVLSGLKLKPGSRVLDAGGPQWLTFALAARNPDVQFQYINYADYEVQPFERIRSELGLDNLTISKEDLRQLSFPDESFDEIFSISVLEHVYPEEGGDALALSEIKRILKQGGSVILTTPCKEKPNVVYVYGDVYERTAAQQDKQFYAREYSAHTLGQLLDKTRYENADVAYISEIPSLLSIDYLEWGPMRGKPLAKLLLRLIRTFARISGLPIERTLAASKLSISSAEAPRLVNAVIQMRKAIHANP
ncbi:MAG: class I SAM-dependent methyltransferase [Pseudomonadota bacterium]